MGTQFRKGSIIINPRLFNFLNNTLNLSYTLVLYLLLKMENIFSFVHLLIGMLHSQSLIELIAKTPANGIHTIRKGFFIQNNQANFALRVHLFCYFFSKVLFLLLQTFSSLKTNKLLNCYISAVFFSNFLYIFSNS